MQVQQVKHVAQVHLLLQGLQQMDRGLYHQMVLVVQLMQLLEQRHLRLQEQELVQEELELLQEHVVQMEVLLI